MKFRMKMGGMEHEVRVVEVDLDLYRVFVDDREFDVEVEMEAARVVSVAPSAATSDAGAAPPAAPPRSTEPTRSAAPAAGGARGVVAPMPGRILRVVAAEGDVVERGTVVAILEAMKMENELRATGDGTVLRVAVKEGQNVSKGDLIVEVG